MQNVKNLSPFAALWLVMAPIVSYAHHSILNYDESTLVEIEGEVTNVYWGNPHIRIAVTSTSETGLEVEWQIEGGPVNTMERRGISRDSILVGHNIQVSGIASDRGDEKAMRPILIGLASGQNLIIDAEQAEIFGLLDDNALPAGAVVNTEAVEAAIRDAHGIFRVWTNRGWINRYRDWGTTVHPLTASAKAAQEGWVQLEDDLALRCIQAGMPEAQLNPFPIEFIKQGDDIIMRIEEWENVRTIHMGGNSDGQPTSPLGYSVGNWEGNTLVIRTNKINYPFFDDRGTPQTQAVVIVERYTLSEDETRLDWLATVTDPGTFTQPIEMPDLHWEWVPGEDLKTYACTPDTAGTPWGARR